MNICNMKVKQKPTDKAFLGICIFLPTPQGIAEAEPINMRPDLFLLGNFNLLAC